MGGPPRERQPRVWAPTPKLSAQRAIIIDARTGDTLFEKNGAVCGQVASTQKLLTALIVARSGNLDSLVSILREDFPEDLCRKPMQLGLASGERYTRRELLIGMLVGSANEATLALARDNAGSVAAFAECMNDAAAELGMKNSHFVNPTGLPDDRQFSTARDLAKLAHVVDSLSHLREIVRLRNFRIKKPDGSEILCENTNLLLRRFSDCDGMKTGFTRAAGYCLVSSGERDGNRRLAVVLNSTRDGVWTDSQRLLGG